MSVIIYTSVKPVRLYSVKKRKYLAECTNCISFQRYYESGWGETREKC